MEGTIFNIQKFCINDGPGIRTTVFLKGCPLNCAWCHNPESKSVKPELLYSADKCIFCGACAVACKTGAHSFSESGHGLNRELCVACGACADVCPTSALEISGYQKSVEDVIREVMKDKIFYDNSGGGMTLSGGEPMAQLEFSEALLIAAKEKGLHTAMETCGFSKTENYEKILPLVDLFLFDWKVSDPTLHKKYTGVDNALIEKNLRFISASGGKIVLRCPIIPTVNDTDSHFAKIAALAEELPGILSVDIEPYHPLGIGKAQRLGKQAAFEELGIPEKAVVDSWIEKIQKMTTKIVKKA